MIKHILMFCKTLPFEKASPTMSAHYTSIMVRVRTHFYRYLSHDVAEDRIQRKHKLQFAVWDAVKGKLSWGYTLYPTCTSPGFIIHIQRH